MSLVQHAAIEIMSKMPRKLSLVKFEPTQTPGSFHRKYPFRRGIAYIFVGEIPNMPGHCVVVNPKTEKMYSGYHIENFVELKEDEL